MDKLLELVKNWHEVSKADYYKRYSDSVLSYDTLYPHTIKEKKLYIYLDEGTSGAFIYEKSTGNIFKIKGYGVIDRKKLIGNILTITGQDLLNRRWNR